MLTTKEEIKKELLNNIDYLKDNPHPEDLVAEISEGYVPVYNNQIIQEWITLPSEHSDQWKEYGYDTQKNPGGIVQLMAVDLAFYYLQLGNEAWQEIEETICREPLQDNMTIRTAHFGGHAVAKCENCEFTSVSWDCVCDFEHECVKEEEQE